MNGHTDPSPSEQSSPEKVKREKRQYFWTVVGSLAGVVGVVVALILDDAKHGQTGANPPAPGGPQSREPSASSTPTIEPPRPTVTVLVPSSSEESPLEACMIGTWRLTSAETAFSTRSDHPTIPLKYIEGTYTLTVNQRELIADYGSEGAGTVIRGSASGLTMTAVSHGRVAESWQIHGDRLFTEQTEATGGTKFFLNGEMAEFLAHANAQQPPEPRVECNKSSLRLLRKDGEEVLRRIG